MRETLDRLQNWFDVHRPEYASCLQPGLSEAEMAEILAEIPSFCLSDEFYELYRWHNGNRLHKIYPNDCSLNDFIPHHRFLPLEEAVKLYQDMTVSAVRYSGEVMMQATVSGHCDWNYYYFPILEKDSDLVIVVGGESKTLSNPVVDRFIEDASITLLHQSLSNFIKFILECYETEVYRLEVNSEDSLLWIETDEVRARLIYRKYDGTGSVQ